MTDRFAKARKAKKTNIREDLIEFYEFIEGGELYMVPTGTRTIPDKSNGTKRDVLIVETESGKRLVGTHVIMAAYDEGRIELGKMYKVTYKGKLKSEKTGREYNDFDIELVEEEG